MKILYSVHGYKPAFRLGGPILSVAATAERLVRKGHHVSVFATNSNLDIDLKVPTDRPLDVEGVQVWYFEHKEPMKKALFFLPYFSKSMGFLYSPAMKIQLDRTIHAVDVVHTHLPFIYPTLATGSSAIRSGKPLFYQQRGVLNPESLKFRGLKKRLYINSVERRLMRKSTTLIALTEAEVASYRALGVQTPCHVIPNGVEIPSLEDTSIRQTEVLGFKHNDVVILFMARLHPLKGADKLIEAFLMIQREFPKAKLVMAGPDEWGIVEKFKRLIASSGAAEHVRFPGMVSGEAKQQLLARADLFCLPSAGEGFSVAVLEAFANSTAALLSPGCHFPEAERAGAAHIVDPDPKSLAQGLATLLKDPGRLEEMGRRGRALVESRYSWDAITDQLEQVYFEGIDRFRRHRA